MENCSVLWVAICALGCHNRLYDNEQLMRTMIREQKNCKIPSALVPKCTICGGEMDANLRKDDYFAQDDYWYECKNRFEQFLNETIDQRIALI